jgi:catechol 2,3-dioxygenase-like lactoylglutathione lyase family enzyme
MFRRIDRLLLRVPNVEAAVRYYRDVLGLKLLRQEATLASFELGDGATEFVLHSDPDLPFEEVYYLVDDVRDLYKRREALQLKFISAPQQVSRGYRAAVRDPFGNVLQLIDQSTETSAASTIESTKTASATLFPGVEQKVATKRDVLIRLYEQIGRTADDLPYTPHFQKMYAEYIAEHDEPKPSRQEVWRHLLNLRKAGKLPKLGEARSTPPPIDAEDREILRKLIGADIGKRDRLPYTERFDQIVDEFNKKQARPLSPHLVWRLVATLAK